MENMIGRNEKEYRLMVREVMDIYEHIVGDASVFVANSNTKIHHTVFDENKEGYKMNMYIGFDFDNFKSNFPDLDIIDKTVSVDDVYTLQSIKIKDNGIDLMVDVITHNNRVIWEVGYPNFIDKIVKNKENKYMVVDGLYFGFHKCQIIDIDSKSLSKIEYPDSKRYIVEVDDFKRFDHHTQISSLDKHDNYSFINVYYFTLDIALMIRFLQSLKSLSVMGHNVEYISKGSKHVFRGSLMENIDFDIFAKERYLMFKVKFVYDITITCDIYMKHDEQLLSITPNSFYYYSDGTTLKINREISDERWMDITLSHFKSRYKPPIRQSVTCVLANTEEDPTTSCPYFEKGDNRCHYVDGILKCVKAYINNEPVRPNRETRPNR